jgi:DnaK suppressor protein
MTKIEQNAFRKTLENLQSELTRGNRNREALAIETSPDDLDRIQHASERDYAMGNLERNSNRLREVQIALERMRAGTFGVCAGCEEDIPLKRLAAVPWASTCVACQEPLDRGEDTFRDEMETSLVLAA